MDGNAARIRHRCTRIRRRSTGTQRNRSLSDRAAAVTPVVTQERALDAADTTEKTCRPRQQLQDLERRAFASRRRCLTMRRSQVGAGPALNEQVLRRPRRAKPLLDHRRGLPVGLLDDAGWRRAARRAANHRPQHPARGGPDRRRERGEQQGDAPRLLASSRRPRRRVVLVRQERHPHRP